VGEERGSYSSPPVFRQRGAYIEACSAAAFHEVLHCQPGRGSQLRDVLLGTKVEVLERSGSQDAAPGDLLFAKVVPIEGVALLEACAPVLLPPQDRIQVQVIELRRKIPADTALSGAELLREYDFELRELLLTLTDRRLYPHGPAVANTDGDRREAMEALLRQFERDMARHDQAANADIATKLRTALETA